MLNLPKIAVCLAAFNGEQHIADQLKSILDQIGVEVTIYVSVDYSSDNTSALVESFCKNDVRVVLLNNGERYGSAAKNFFSLLRDGQFKAFDYVALSDQDDLWQDEKLFYAVQHIQEKHVHAYSSNVTAFWPAGKQYLINKAQPQKEFDFMFESAGPGCTFVITQNLATEIQLFLVANYENCQQVALHDWFIYAFARSRGYIWYINHESHMLYRQHLNNVVGANVGFKAKLQRFAKLREGWLFKQATLISEILGYANAIPIQKINRLNFFDRAWLVINVSKLRRRVRDCIALVFLLLIYKNK